MPHTFLDTTVMGDDEDGGVPMIDQRQIETWFRRRGFASLLEGTAMHRDPRRLARALSVLFVVSLLVINPLSGASVTRLLIAGVIALIVTWVGLNLMAKRRPLTPPRVVTWRERAAFVLAPAVAMLAAPLPGYVDEFIELLPSEVTAISAASTALGQLVLLWATSVVVRSGFVSAFRWLGRMVVESFLSAGAALGRTIPLLLGVVGLLYFGAEIWQSIGRLATWAYPVVLGLFIALSLSFLHSHDRLDIERLSTFVDPAEVTDILSDTPLAPLADVPLPAQTPLTDHQVKDLRLVATFARITVVTVISVAVFAFFVVLGFTAVNAEVVKAWVSGDPHILWSFNGGDRRYDLTYEHLRAAAFLGVFAGFYFSVVSRTDPTMGEGVRDTAEETVREACAARLVALNAYPRVAASVDEDAPNEGRTSSDQG